MQNLLAWFKFDVGEGAFYSVFGFVFVFLGIALLVGIFVIEGMIMKKVNARKPRVKKSKKKAAEETKAEEQPSIEEGISPETVAAITAAVACVLQEESAKCDFVVRRIKKL